MAKARKAGGEDVRLRWAPRRYPIPGFALLASFLVVTFLSIRSHGGMQLVKAVLNPGDETAAANLNRFEIMALPKSARRALVMAGRHARAMQCIGQSQVADLDPVCHATLDLAAGKLPDLVAELQRGGFAERFEAVRDLATTAADIAERAHTLAGQTGKGLAQDDATALVNESKDLARTAFAFAERVDSILVLDDAQWNEEPSGEEKAALAARDARGPKLAEASRLSALAAPKALTPAPAAPAAAAAAPAPSATDTSPQPASPLARLVNPAPGSGTGTGATGSAATPATSAGAGSTSARASGATAAGATTGTPATGAVADSSAATASVKSPAGGTEATSSQAGHATSATAGPTEALHGLAALTNETSHGSHPAGTTTASSGKENGGSQTTPSSTSPSDPKELARSLDRALHDALDSLTSCGHQPALITDGAYKARARLESMKPLLHAYEQSGTSGKSAALAQKVDRARSLLLKSTIELERVMKSPVGVDNETPFTRSDDLLRKAKRSIGEVDAIALNARG
jgi:DNA-binding protein HU-beta